MDKKQRELVMAKLYLKNKDYKMAEKSFNEYLVLNPEDVSALKLLGQVYEQINKFDKAFEMYERCYLAEPERTGVLLDICRILLMQGNCIDHDTVDYRKWLNLAIKAFPSNPIVVNFKALLSTLPSDEQVVVNKDTPNKSTNNTSFRNSTEDPLLKVLEKLTSMEKRLETIEDKLNNLSITEKSKSETYNQFPTPAVGQSQKEVSIFKSSPTPISAFNPSLNPVSAVKPSTNQVSAVNLSTNQVSTVAPSHTPVSTTNPSPKAAQTPVSSIFSATFSTPTTTQASGLMTIPAPSLFTTSTTKPFSFSNNLFGEAPKELNLPSTFSFSQSPFKTTTTTTTANSEPFNAPTSVSSMTNLFAQSLNKYNVPNTFSFSQKLDTSTTTPITSVFSQQEDEKENKQDGDDEVVQNEELPIENTCDMTPIDYKTGEEDENLLFEHRCKLFRFRDKEYKERGLGNIKVLKHKQNSKGRLIMRRDAVGLVCLNCWDCHNIEQVKDTQIKFAGVDASDGQAEPTLFIARFKLKETADTFLNLMLTLFGQESGSANTSVSYIPSKAAAPSSKQNDRADSEEKPEVELVDPKLDIQLVEKARELKLPDLFYHKLKNQQPCEGCNGCEND